MANASSGLLLYCLGTVTYIQEICKILSHNKHFHLIIILGKGQTSIVDSRNHDNWQPWCSTVWWNWHEGEKTWGLSWTSLCCWSQCFVSAQEFVLYFLFKLFFCLIICSIFSFWKCFSVWLSTFCFWKCFSVWCFIFSFWECYCSSHT